MSTLGWAVAVVVIAAAWFAGRLIVWAVHDVRRAIKPARRPPSSRVLVGWSCAECQMTVEATPPSMATSSAQAHRSRWPGHTITTWPVFK